MAKKDMALLDPKKEAALLALAESNTLTEAAEKAGICRKTLYNYIRYDYDFARAYRALQEESAVRAMEAAEDHQRRAIDVILEIMEDANETSAIRLKAAQVITELTVRRDEIAMNIATENVSRTAPSIFDI